MGRCCCGKYMKDFDEPLIHNTTKHEVLGPPGNFCGPYDHHIIRDQQAAIKELVEALEKITHEIDDYDESRQWVSAATLERCIDLLAKYKTPSK